MTQVPQDPQGKTSKSETGIAAVVAGVSTFVRRCLPIFCSAAAAGTLALLVVPPDATPVSNPQHSMEAQLSVPSDINGLLHRSCMDCHSSQTRWPWYSHLPAVSAFLRRDVARAQEAVNFSEWTMQSGRTPRIAASTLLAVCEDARSSRMPPTPYRLLHSGAGFTVDEQKRLCSWTRREAKRLIASKRTRQPGSITAVMSR